MNLNLYRSSKRSSLSTLRVSVLLLLAGLATGWAQTTVSSNPLNGATGVSATAPVVFTFSAAVDPGSTFVTFLSANSPAPISVNTNWNSADTVLTCTPVSPFPANTNISWDLINVTAGLFVAGSFSTSTNSSGGGGSGTNAFTTFGVGKLYIYQQLTAGAPTPVPSASYAFQANTSLASNQPASGVTVTLPTGGAAISLNPSPAQPADYYLFASGADSNTFESTYPEGNYIFNVIGSPTNLQATVTLPTTMQQPNAPHITDFTNAQSLNATNAFTLTWDPFQGGTASDYISVSVTGEFGTNLFQTPNIGTNGALNGTSTSVMIPAGILPANSTNLAQVVFYRFLATSNTFSTFAYRATGTQFNIQTTTGSSASTPPVAGNPVWSGANFGFDVNASPNQVVKVLYSPDCSMPVSQWQTLLTTNSPGNSFHVTVPSQGGTAGFFRLQNGP